MRGWGVAFLGYVADNNRRECSVRALASHRRHRAWAHRHFRKCCRQRSRHPLWSQTPHRDGHAGVHPDRRDHRLSRQHVLCRCRCAHHAVRHRHLAQLLIPHGGNGWYGRAFATRRDARRAFHARLCGRLCWPFADRLDARSVRRNVASRLGDVVPLGGSAHGSSRSSRSGSSGRANSRAIAARDSRAASGSRTCKSNRQRAWTDVRPHGHRRQCAGNYADHGVGHELLLSRRAGEADRRRDRLGHEHGFSRLQRRAPRHGLHLDVGRPADRSDWCPRGDVDRYDRRFGRTPCALAGARPGELFGCLGGARRRHALLSL